MFDRTLAEDLSKGRYYRLSSFPIFQFLNMHTSINRAAFSVNARLEFNKKNICLIFNGQRPDFLFPLLSFIFYGLGNQIDLLDTKNYIATHWSFAWIATREETRIELWFPDIAVYVANLTLRDNINKLIDELTLPDKDKLIDIHEAIGYCLQFIKRGDSLRKKFSRPPFFNDEVIGLNSPAKPILSTSQAEHTTKP